MSKAKAVAKRFIALTLILVLTVGLIPVMGENAQVKAAAGIGGKTITGLGTGGITNPIEPDNSTTDETGRAVLCTMGNMMLIQRMLFLHRL